MHILSNVWHVYCSRKNGFPLTPINIHGTGLSAKSMKFEVTSIQDVKPFLLWTTTKNILPTFIVLFGGVIDS